MTPEVLRAILLLLESINNDENRHGGLLSRETHRRAGALRVALSQAREDA